jgi:serine/threonine protein kinase
LVSPPPPALEVPSGAECIIVVTLLQSQELSQQYILDLLASGREGLPPILVLLINGEGASDADSVLEAQQSFRMIGARDILLQRSTSSDTCLDIDLALHRIADTAEDVQQQFAHILVEHDNSKFWLCVHRIFKGFQKFQQNFTEESLASGSRFCDYELLEILGQGGFSKVYRSKNVRTGEDNAVKVIAKSKLVNISHVVSVWQEQVHLANLKHPNVVRLLEVHHGSWNILLIFEFCGWRTLRKHISLQRDRRLHGRAARELLWHLLQGLAYCHEQGVAHRDMKPENCAVSDAVDDRHFLKVLDFGCAVRSNKLCTDVTGTMPFIAPEVLIRKSRGYWPTLADIWSTGVILMEMICGIGKLAKIMEWDSSQTPERVMGEDLISYFRDREKFVSAIQAIAGGNSAEDSLLQLFFQLLHVSPEERCSARDASTCNWIANSIDGSHGSEDNRS